MNKLVAPREIEEEKYIINVRLILNTRTRRTLFARCFPQGKFPTSSCDVFYVSEK